MSVPLELKLISTPDGPRLTRWPVKELESLCAATDRTAPKEMKASDRAALSKRRTTT